MDKEKFIPFASRLGLIITTIIWGFAFVVVKNSLDIIPPIYILAFRFTLAAVLLWIIFQKKMRKLTKAELRQGFVLGFWLYVAYALQTVGLIYTTAGKNAFLTTIYVITVPFLYFIAYRKKLGAFTVISAVIATVGVGLLSLESDFSVNRGDILTLLCGICFAMQIFFIDKYTEKTEPVKLTVLQLAFSALLSWVSAPVIDGKLSFSIFTPEAIGSIAFLGIFSTMIGFLLQNVCQKHLPMTTSSLLLSFEAVFGALFSVIFLGEKITLKVGAGCALMFFAVILSETNLSFLRKSDKKRDCR